MNNNKKGLIERLIYNNKLLMIFSVVMAICIWAAVKVNYSDETYRTLTDVKINITNTVDETSDMIAFVDEEELYCEVEVQGKSYDINSYSLSKDDIIVEATGTYVDSAGYKVLNLSAKTTDGGLSGVEITKVTPSTITVYYDRKSTDTFNVEAKLSNDLATLVEGEYAVGQPVPSMNTVEVTGPTTILNKLKMVYFTAEINAESLPLTASKDIAAEITFGLDRQSEAKYLICEGINDESNPATVTVPVYVTKSVATGVKFVNQPAVFTDEVTGVTVSPSKVKISYNPKDDEQYDMLYVGTIDFSNISNKVNVIEFPVDEKLGVTLADESVDKFTVRVDMSSMSSLTLDKAPTKVIFLNQDENYNYSVDFENSELSNIVVIGPKESLSKITVDDIQIEINVSSLNVNARTMQTAEISNISIQSEDINDCWVYGKYEAVINIDKK